MDELNEIQEDWGKRDRLLARLDTMAASGRVTKEEAERFRTARDPGAFGEVMRDIRVRHAEAALGAAVEDGRMSREEADGFLERMRIGDHSPALRGEMGGIRAAGPKRADALGEEP